MIHKNEVMDSNVFKVFDNNIGISFQWKKNAALTQVIFRDIGFHLSMDEIELFMEETALSRSKQPCLGCKLGADCRSMLLQTPVPKVSIAVSLNELNEIEELLKGTLFQLQLDYYLHELCRN